MDFILGGYWLLAGQPYFVTSRLYEPTAPDAEAVRATIAKWTAFAKAYRAPRPSGGAGLLYSSMIHLLRPSLRGLEAVAHVTADSSLPMRALISVLNPTASALQQRVTVPLYYTGLAPGTTVNVSSVAPSGSGIGAGWLAATRAPLRTSANETHVLGGDKGAGFTEIVVEVTVEPASYAVLGVSV